ncbi:arginine repressor [Lactovum miscens]|uniref:Arginine repressor n=1 Tax=Lactovum miscens TaxID=190387 RepID=A0A841CBP8_9LACT|nr:arginine repressor [Lactovum miscens]MBB5888600.1 transcriptional regulator of arginine metabolism [Lactovum miscens]
MNKQERIELLKSLIANKEIDRQEDIVQLFKERGFEVTQATISRDIKNLGFSKVQTSQGTYKYIIPDESPFLSSNQVNQFIQQVEIQDNLIRIDVRPGSSMRVKNVLQTRFASWIFALLVDDKTVLIVGKSEVSAQLVYKELVNK